MARRGFFRSVAGGGGGEAAGVNRHYPVAVWGDVRTTGYASGESGALDDLSGVYQGVNHTLNSPGPTFSDGTPDGTYNYSADWSGGSVFRFDRDWSQWKSTLGEREPVVRHAERQGGRDL